jgi:TRAP-type mannitol/chloroaromatic compound transport system substrate-binding protein
MTRRIFVKGLASGVAVGAGMMAGSAHAQTAPEVKWRLTTGFPKTLDTLHGAAEMIAKRVAAATGGKFQIQTFPAGEIVPGNQVIDSVQSATVQAGLVPLNYGFGKDPTFALAAVIPFGMNARQQNAWMYQGGGLELMREFLREYNIINFPAGNTAAQMGGWYRKEIKSVADLNGLKLRITGLGGMVLSKLGVVPQQIPAGDIYTSLEKGTLDAVEFVGPDDDEKLGFFKVAKNYYYPGFWEGGAQVDLIVNLKAWESLPKEYQAILEAAAAEANVNMLAKYDALNSAALRRLVSKGAVLRAFPNDVISAAYKVAHELYDELSSKNAKFKKVYDHWRSFRDEQIAWFSVAEGRFDSIMASAQRSAQKKK